MIEMAQADSLINGQAHTLSDADNPQGIGHPRVSVTYYTADEVIRQFLGLYYCLDFKAELEDIGITRLQFIRRGKAIREFRAICIALWGLALQKSFPNDAGDFFSEFREKAPMLVGGGKESARLYERVNAYIEMLELKKDTDFSTVADLLAKTLAPHAEEVPRLRLRLSLIIRNLYVLIFDKLV